MTTAESTKPTRRRKAVEKSPAFQLYTKDLLSDGNVLAMNLTEFGAYVKLMAICWNECGLPNDDERLARMLGISVDEFDPIWRDISRCFYLFADQWQHGRLDEERRKQAKFRKQKKNAADARWHKSQCGRNADALQSTSDASPVQCSASSSSSAFTDLSTHSQRALDSQPISPSLSQRAGDFCQWYESTHDRIIGIGYIGTRKDYESALRLVAKFSDEQCRDAAIVWFGMDDDFATNGTRTVPKFASRITRCLELMKQRGIA